MGWEQAPDSGASRFAAQARCPLARFGSDCERRGERSSCRPNRELLGFRHHNLARTCSVSDRESLGWAASKAGAPRCSGNRNFWRDDTKENGMGDKGGKKDKAKNDKQKKSGQDSKKKDKKK